MIIFSWLLSHLLFDVSEGVHGQGGEVLLGVGQPQVQGVHGLIEELGHELPLWLELGWLVRAGRTGRAGRAGTQTGGEGENPGPAPDITAAHGAIARTPALGTTHIVNNSGAATNL